LINTYCQIRDNVDNVIHRLTQLEIDPQQYLAIRDSRPRTPVTRAVRFIYLNRTAFNGIYRVNREGKFNVPFGCKPNTELCDDTLLRASSQALQNRSISVCDFEEAIDSAKQGDLIYADPPYTTKHDNNGFRRYNNVIFSWEDQERLALSCHRAASRGVHVYVSNASHGPLLNLYKGFSRRTVSRISMISGKTSGRGAVNESLLFSR
jgi:DNA adenine methylase